MNENLQKDEERRLALADFLRTRRARLTPADVGLPESTRRRTPGLRREEVAELAHIGVSWYTALEQGRNIQPSVQVLNSLAQALHLTRAEQQHLFTLSREPLFIDPPFPAEQAGPALERMLRSLQPHPAYVMGRRWDLLHWNLAAETVFNLSQIPGPHSRNMLWRAFAMPELMKNPNWSKMAQGLVAQFRADYALYPGDPWFEELKHDLEEASPDFVRFWSEHQVMEMPDCHKEFNHPELGDLEFEYAAFQVTTVTGMKLAVYTASPATAVKLAGDGTSAGPPQSVLYPLTASDRGDGLS